MSGEQPEYKTVKCFIACPLCGGETTERIMINKMTSTLGSQGVRSTDHYWRMDGNDEFELTGYYCMKCRTHFDKEFIVLKCSSRDVLPENPDSSQ